VEGIDVLSRTDPTMTLLSSSDSSTGRSSIAPRFVGRPALDRWVEDVRSLTRPDDVVWCDGSPAEQDRLLKQMVADGSLIRLDPERRPNSYLARSDPDDVARVEDRTFICSPTPAQAGPTNNWRNPVEMRAELQARFSGSMRGRTMYVLPFSMGPVGGALSELGVQITDSPYVVASTAIMTRMGDRALAAIAADTRWVPALHTVGMPLVGEDGERIPDVAWPSNGTKIIAHFPTTREIWSFGSGYGGNALLAKKCFALRIASVMAREEGWLAEHMLLMRVTAPDGRAHHIAAAFPSACGKTNFAMMRPTRPGWRVETLGDDIAWLRPGLDGRLRAANPEAGFFGVAPGTGEATNPAAMATMRGNTIFTNVALREDGDVWWEGMTPTPPPNLTDWQGNPWTSESGRPAAHPNARFTVPADQCPVLADDWDSPDGVPLDAIVFGGRRASNVPLVSEAADWVDGVFTGATIASEQTAAAEGPVGQLRFDPFAMLPFCGYDMADHWQHWLDMGERLGAKAPRIFRVNWFRKGDDGRYLWPGFGDNIRVIDWIVARLAHEVDAVPTPVGSLPYRHDLDLDGLELPDDDVRELLTVDAAGWRRECDQIQEHFARFGRNLPPALARRLTRLRWRLHDYR
jgi:phosphoenolpyruvate carboxykinase (GTP)